MDCALGIAMMVFGIMALATGRLTFDKKKGLSGGPAYLAGLLLLLAFPAVMVVAFTAGFNAGASGREMRPDEMMTLVAITWGILLGDLLIVGLIFAMASGPLPVDPAKRNFRDDDDYDRRGRDRDRYDDDDRDRGGRRGFRDDDDYDRRRDDEDRPRDPRIRSDD